MPALNTTTDSARTPHAIQPAVPMERDSAQVLASGRILEFILQDGQDLVLTSLGKKTQAAVPVKAARMLLSILDQMARGNPVAVVPLRKELSVRQAADILRVSRPFLMQLLKDGKIPYRMLAAMRKQRTGLNPTKTLPQLLDTLLNTGRPKTVDLVDLHIRARMDVDAATPDATPPEEP